MIHIITQFYIVNYGMKKERQEEINKCIINNINNNQVKNIHVLYLDEKDKEYLKNLLETDKIIYKKINNILKYSDVFKYYNEFIDNEICVYLHADMYLGLGFDNITNNMLKQTVYFLIPHKRNCNFELNCKCSRKVKTKLGLFSSGAFDGFVFNGNINSNIIRNSNFQVNTLGGETKLIALFKLNQYDVFSTPVLQSFHLHKDRTKSGFNDSTYSRWITLNGTFKPREYFSMIHKDQASKNKPYEDRIVGGGIPFYLGSVLIKKKL